MLINLKKITLSLLICVAAGFVINNCTNNNATDSIEEPPYITGHITEVNSNEEGETQRILVEEDTTVHEPADPGGEKIWFGLNDQTELLIRQDDGSLSESTIETLEVGQKVEGWTTGVIAESYPEQTTAKRIVVLSFE